MTSIQHAGCRAAAGSHLHKVAHDSGDGMTVYHCPFCGSGQVIARSDRTIQCQFCTTAFTVQVQPQFPAFPQTINGQPVQVPGMPGQIAPDMAGGAIPPEQGPMDPAELGEDGEVPTEDPSELGEEPEEEDEDDAPPWAKKSSLFVTASGHALTPEEYRNHLAIKAAANPRQMAAQIKARRS